MQTNTISEQENDVGAELAAVLRLNSARWMQISTAILRNRADAEDVLHEAIRRMLRRNIHFSSQESMRQYLGRAVGNTALDLYRRRKRERRRYAPVADEFLTRPAAERHDPYRPDFIMEEAENCVEREERLRLLRRGLNALSSKQYEALRMTMLGNDDDVTFRDLESSSGIPRSTIRHRSMRGLDVLRKYMKREMQSARGGRQPQDEAVTG